VLLVSLAAFAGSPMSAGPALPSEIKIGVVTFLSGGAAAPFGIPARNAAEVIFAELNAGRVPAPYTQRGIGGVPIRPVIIDEAGGADRQVAEFRRLVLDERVDLVIGYISSADCLAVAPVAEELRALLVLFDCGTNRIFEERRYTYVFRTHGHQILDNVGAARYVVAQRPGVASIAGINQNYAWGQDSWRDFRDSMRKLKPDVRVVTEQFPALFAGEYSAELSALLAARPEIIHTSFWGGDLESFLVQGFPRGIYTHHQLVLTTGDTVLPRLGADMPPGVIVGGRGPHGALAPDNALNRWFKTVYTERFGTRPVYPSYHMSQAIFGVKTAYERAIARVGGWPTKEQVIAAFRGITFETPSGPIRMALGNGHQAIEPVAYGITGTFNTRTKERDLTRVLTFRAECVNPPEGMKSEDWIAQGFPQARCP
jgi:branched-chain amino acid transport system substrate-binding protein